MIKPSVFIGSSSEGIRIAAKIKTVLKEVAETTLWKEDFFPPGNTFIETLVNSLPTFDFAILVFTPDDLTKSRDTELFSPRDNVIFEAGLFMGKLGRQRTIILLEDVAGLKMPSDLSGLTTLTYSRPKGGRSYDAAVSSACNSIKKIVDRLGPTEERVVKMLEEIKYQQKRQDAELSKQQTQIRSLQVALQGIITRYEFDKKA